MHPRLINGCATVVQRFSLYSQVNAALTALEPADGSHSSNDEIASHGSAGGTSTVITTTAATVTAASTADTDKHGRSRALVNADDWVSCVDDIVFCCKSWLRRTGIVVM